MSILKAKETISQWRVPRGRLTKRCLDNRDDADGYIFWKVCDTATFGLQSHTSAHQHTHTHTHTHTEFCESRKPLQTQQSNQTIKACSSSPTSQSISMCINEPLENKLPFYEIESSALVTLTLAACLLVVFNLLSICCFLWRNIWAALFLELYLTLLKFFWTLSSACIGVQHAQHMSTVGKFHYREVVTCDTALQAVGWAASHQFLFGMQNGCLLFLLHVEAQY